MTSVDQVSSSLLKTEDKIMDGLMSCQRLLSNFQQSFDSDASDEKEQESTANVFNKKISSTKVKDKELVNLKKQSQICQDNKSELNSSSELSTSCETSDNVTNTSTASEEYAEDPSSSFDYGTFNPNLGLFAITGQSDVMGLCIGAFYCPHCKYSTRLRGDLNRHIAAVHIKEKPFHCCECSYRTSQKCHLNTHVRSVHMKDKSFACHLCHYRSSRKSSLNRHILMIHKAKGKMNDQIKDEILESMAEPGISEGDEVKESNPSLMAQAEAVHSVDGLFNCPTCNYSTKWKGDLYRHVAFVHIGDKPYQCPECSYQAKQKSHLTIHIKSVHAKDKSFQCPECEYHCSRRCSLNRHIMAIHKGEKPYQCPECPYQASQSGNLRHHLMIIHRGEKPFHCPQCPFQATKRDTLNRHIKSVHYNDGNQ